MTRLTGADSMLDRPIAVLGAGNGGCAMAADLALAGHSVILVQLLETNTLPYGARVTGDGEAFVSVLASHVLTAGLPIDGRDSEQAVSLLQQLWPSVLQWPDVISVALSNPNPVVHPPGALLNVGRIQHSDGNFYLYREGITEAVARVIRLVYTEVAAVAAALGGTVPGYSDWSFRTKTTCIGAAFQAPFDTEQGVRDKPR